MDDIGMRRYRHRVLESASFLRARLPGPPDAAVLTGTGLSRIGEALEDPLVLDYRDIPHYPVPTVESHPGWLLAGTLEGRRILVFQGRLHLYEGWSPLEVIFPVRLLRELGGPVLVLTNAAGGLNPGFRDGDVMRISDHINLTGANPLAGPALPEWGPRFPDLSRAYDPGLAEAARRAARALGLPLREGVYAGLRGPSLETPAEVRFLRTAGADAVGFSTVLEVIAAVQAGLRVLALSVITNVHLPEDPRPAPLEEILAVAGSAAPKVADLVRETLRDR